MDLQTERYLASFSRRADARLATLARELAGALAGGDSHRAGQLHEEGLLLSHGLVSCESSSNQLTSSQRLYIAGKLLPLTQQMPDTNYSATLTLNPLPARRRGIATAGTELLVSGSVQGTFPPGAQLVITRDGIEVSRLPAQIGAYRFTDATPGMRYRVEVTGTSLSREGVRPLVSAVLYGTGPTGASLAYLRTLAAAELPGSPYRLSFVGNTNRMLICVPVALGAVTAATQPDDNDADILMAFTRRQVVLDFGADGQDTYEVLENYSDFIGPFTADFKVGI